MDASMAPGPQHRWSAFTSIAARHRQHFALIALLTLLATGADLLAPVIYREAVNDIAGLFVGSPGTTGVDQLQGVLAQEDAGNESTPAVVAPPPDPRTPHSRGHVAPRTAEQALATLLWAVVLLFVLNVVSHYFSLSADQRTVMLASRIEADVIQRAFAHVLRQPLTFFARRSTGSLAKQIDQSDQISPIVTAVAHQVLPEVITAIGVVAIMLVQSWKLALVALVTLPPYIWLATRSSKRLETGLDEYYGMWDGVSTRIHDALAAVKTVKLSGAERREAASLRQASDEAYATLVKRNRLANRYVFWQTALSYLSEALVLGYGGFLVFEHQLTPGDVVMFVVYLDKLYSPVESLAGLAVSLQENLVSLQRALALLRCPAERAGGRPLEPGPGRIEVARLSFRYRTSREVLSDVSFTLEAGRVTALVGPSGAGKTTLADLLLRLFVPTHGSIRIDGQDIADLDPARLRASIGLVAADGAMFRGTLADNIRYKRPEASDADVREAALAAGLGLTLERLPEGIDTEVGEDGVGLSVGERQRVQIARALVGRPRLLVLDEATANLDYGTEAEIRTALLGGRDHPTTLVIAHRYAMVEHADHVILLDNGSVVDQGSPVELIARNSWFARFAAASGREGDPPRATAAAHNAAEATATHPAAAGSRIDDDAGIGFERGVMHAGATPRTAVEERAW